MSAGPHPAEDGFGIGIPQRVHARGHACGFHLHASNDLVRLLDRVIYDVVIDHFGALELGAGWFNHHGQVGEIVAVVDNQLEDLFSCGQELPPESVGRDSAAIVSHA